MKQKMEKVTLCLFGILFLIAGTMPIKAQSDHRTIPDHYVISFGVYQINGRIFNAIDPHFLVNRHGFFSGSSRLSFELNAFKDPFAFHPFDAEICPNQFSAIQERLGAVLVWNYFINDKLLSTGARALVSALMPRAIERVTFTPVPADSANVVHNHILRRPIDKETGRVRIYTRPLPHAVPDENMLYLLDGVVITPRIFEAIRPIYIKSLERITDSDALRYFNQSDLQEVVKVETFSQLEGAQRWARFGHPPILLVDDIELPLSAQRKLNSDFFKRVLNYSGSSARRQQFPGARSFTIITL